MVSFSQPPLDPIEKMKKKLQILSMGQLTQLHNRIMKGRRSKIPFYIVVAELDRRWKNTSDN